MIDPSFFQLMKRPAFRVSGFCLPLIAAIGCGGNPGGAPPEGMNRTPTVTVSPVEKRAIADEVSLVGRIGAKDRADIRAQVDGMLITQNFKEGAEVKKGELLFEIEPADYEFALSVADARVSRAKADRDQAASLLERLQSVKSGGVSATDLEAAEIGARKMEAALNEAVAARQMAELDLERTRIRAPIDGQIGKAMVDVGNLVDTSTGTLATIVQLDPIRVRHSLSERMLTNILERAAGSGETLPPGRDTLRPRIVLSNGTTYDREGELVFLDNEVGSTTGSIQAEAEFPNPERMLKPGMFVELIVQRSHPVERLLAPQSAVQQDQKGHFVLVVDAEGNVSQRRVKTGDRFGTEWSIEDGVAAGEKVIIQGIEKVRPGVQVTAVENETAPPESETVGAAAPAEEKVETGETPSSESESH